MCEDNNLNIWPTEGLSNPSEEETQQIIQETHTKPTEEPREGNNSYLRELYLQEHGEPLQTREERKLKQQEEEELKKQQRAATRNRRSKQLKQLGELYQAQHERIINSSETRKAINKGLNEGQNIKELFLMACECIAQLTGDNVFYENAKTKIK